MASEFAGNFIVMTPENVEAFLQAVAADGRSEETVKNYGRNLAHFRAWLPEDKTIRRGTIEQRRACRPTR